MLGRIKSKFLSIGSDRKHNVVCSLAGGIHLIVSLTPGEIVAVFFPHHGNPGATYLVKIEGCSKATPFRPVQRKSRIVVLEVGHVGLGVHRPY